MIDLLFAIISIYAYSLLDGSSLLIVASAVLVNYVLAFYVKNNHYVLIAGIVSNIALVTYYRLFSAHYPLGLSYFLLQFIAYLVDVYNSEMEAEKNPVTFALYIMMYPHFFMGPIILYDEFKREIHKKKVLNVHNFYRGLLRMILGLFKKLVIAARLTVFINNIKASGIQSGGLIVFACLLYSIALYCDFSGGMDLVCGFYNMFDMHFIENFRNPFSSESVREFYGRWHVSLGRWFKKYVYIPLGGNRCSTIRQIINVLAVFVLSGLWHGSGFLLWGLISGLMAVFIKPTAITLFNKVLTYLLVSFSWLFFIFPNYNEAFAAFLSVFNAFNYQGLVNGLFGLGLLWYDWAIVLAGILAVCLLERRKEHFENADSPVLRISFICVLLIVVIVFGNYGLDFKVEDFIYSRF